MLGPICGPAPQLGLPYWLYNLDTIIKGYIEETEYTVRDLVEGYIDDNGHPTGKKKRIFIVTHISVITVSF